jgi:uridine kinase
MTVFYHSWQSFFHPFHLWVITGFLNLDKLENMFYDKYGWFFFYGKEGRMIRRPYKSIEQRGQDVLKFFKDFVERNAMSPTYDEIVAGLGLSTKSHLFNIVDY